MKPVEFKEQNVVYGKDQKEYEPLPALLSEGQVITCWEISWKEVLKLIFSRRIWLCQLTFNQHLQPVFMSTKKEEMFTTEEK